MAVAALLVAAAAPGRAQQDDAKPADPPPVAKSVKSHALSMYGDVKYPAGFQHFDYVNPNAPKGGRVRFYGGETFDTLHPWIIRGVPAPGSSSINDTLMINSEDEPFTQYGLVAEFVEVPEDRSWVIYYLNPKARFHDGAPITADDVLFSLDMLRTKGRPFYRAYYASVAKSEKLDDRTVKFTFKPGQNRELPLILGQLPVLPKHYWEKRNFEAVTLDPPLGSGPYKIGAVDAGRSITMERVKDYWAADLPPNRGQSNFDAIQYVMFRDATIAREALKAGDLDFRAENSALGWATQYDIPAVRDGQLIRKLYPSKRTEGMQGFVFNTRKPMFADRRVRQALGLMFDFTWSNKNLFYGQYTATRSYFDNSELSARGLPQGEELRILEQYRGKVPDEVFTQEYKPPVYDGTGNIRDGMRKAFALLKEAGYEVRNFRLVNAKTGAPFEFEFLIDDPTWERIALPYISNLKRLGIVAKARLVDSSQFILRTRKFDYDMIVGVFGQSESPGNEQRNFWSSAAADEEGSENTIGIKDPVIDELVEKLIAATTRPSLVAHVRALDRVLQWGYYVVPNWHIASDRLIYWNRFGIPDQKDAHSYVFGAWWLDPAKDAALRAGRNNRKSN
ncbi:MAG: extracellular solute-binding protein [Alphaproteobacteria bacterium]